MSRDRKTLILDKYECGVLFHALNDKRNALIDEDKPTDAVDDLLLKVIPLVEEKKKESRMRNEAR